MYSGGHWEGDWKVRAYQLELYCCPPEVHLVASVLAYASVADSMVRQHALQVSYASEEALVLEFANITWSANVLPLNTLHPFQNLHPLILCLTVVVGGGIVPLRAVLEFRSL